VQRAGLRVAEIRGRGYYKRLINIVYFPSWRYWIGTACVLLPGLRMASMQNCGEDKIFKGWSGSVWGLAFFDTEVLRIFSISRARHNRPGER
jgi:hypothetical protein